MESVGLLWPLISNSISCSNHAPIMHAHVNPLIPLAIATFPVIGGQVIMMFTAQDSVTKSHMSGTSALYTEVAINSYRILTQECSQCKWGYTDTCMH